MVNILGFAKKILFPAPKNVQGFVVPFSPVARGATAIKAGQSSIKTFFKNLPNAVKSKTIFAGAGQPITKIPKAMGKAAVVGGVTGAGINIAYQGSKSTITGETPNIMDLLRSTKKSAMLGATFGISPIGALAGTVRGTEIVTGKAAKDVILNLFNKGKDLGQSRIEDATNIFKMPDVPIIPNYSPVTNINFPEMQGYSGMGGVYYAPPSFAPSLNVSGGAGGYGENLPLLMLLLASGAGIGGYLYGKRKKKKYKKKRKHK